MLGRCGAAACIVVLLDLAALAAAQRPSDIYVPHDQQWRCPPLAPRARPEIARDVRPDDIRVVAAIGDSITAGFVARTNRHDKQDLSPDSGSAQTPLLPPIKELREYRGLSYPIGGDYDALTLPNILSYYVPDLVGASRGDRAITFEAESVMRAEDGLNAATGGATSQALIAQVSERLLPAIKQLLVDTDAWTFLSVGIGANDICAFCNTAATDSRAIGSPEDFAHGIKNAVELFRQHVPNLIVNIIGTFRVSDIYNITSRDPYCRGPLDPPGVPRLPLGCSCAFSPGIVGDTSRKRMDDLGQRYDEAVLQVLRDWEQEGDPRFGAMW